MTDKYKSLNRVLGERVEERGAAVLQLEAEAASLELEVAAMEEEQDERIGRGKYWSDRLQTAFFSSCSSVCTQYCFKTCQVCDVLANKILF